MASFILLHEIDTGSGGRLNNQEQATRSSSM
jgi:hypothetical protein